METKNNSIDTLYGVNIINRACVGIKVFQGLIKTKKPREQMFKLIFRESVWKHLSSKYDGYNDFASFYLNLDGDCQQRLIKFIFTEMEFTIDVEYPAITDWETLADKYKLTGANRTEAMVRKLCITFRDKTKWEVWPHSLVWLYKWMIYINNHGIDGFGLPEAVKANIEEYQGDRFGNFKNWAAFWDWCLVNTKLEIIDKLAQD